MGEVSDALRAKIITLKVGSALLVDQEGSVRSDWLSTVAEDISLLSKRGQRVVVVTSGAIALGRRALGLRRRPQRLEEKQAAAAAGQIVLASAWRESLAGQGIHAAQLLLTLDDTEGRRRYLNARATIASLLKMRAVPVVNENDTVATTEIRFGDNDRLGARVAVMAGSETLILLSDVDGLYSADPRRDSSASHIPIVATIDRHIEAMAGESSSDEGTGGMVSKLVAASTATNAGTAVILAKGRCNHPIQAVQDGAKCTLFRAKGSPRRARKEWIGARHLSPGTLFVDNGALDALRRGASLLPAGVTRVDGVFERGDAVVIQTSTGETIAKGLSAYDAGDARLIAGKKTSEVAGILGWRGRDEIVHRDDLVML